MTPNSLATLEAEAMTLSPGDRVVLADRLLASVAPESDVDDAWSVEVERRLAAIESGAMALVSFDQATARAKQALE